MSAAIDLQANNQRERGSDKAFGISRQYSTFSVADCLYGIDVTRVQEVVRPIPITPIPLAPSYVSGLINLRGQVATTIGLRELFGLRKGDASTYMNMVCRIDGVLVSLQVDEIGDVLELKVADFEPTPQTVPLQVRRFMSGISKISGSLLSILELDQIGKFLNQKQ